MRSKFGPTHEENEMKKINDKANVLTVTYMVADVMATLDMAQIQAFIGENGHLPEIIRYLEEFLKTAQDLHRPKLRWSNEQMGDWLHEVLQQDEEVDEPECLAALRINETQRYRPESQPRLLDGCLDLGILRDSFINRVRHEILAPAMIQFGISADAKQLIYGGYFRQGVTDPFPHWVKSLQQAQNELKLREAGNFIKLEQDEWNQFRWEVYPNTSFVLGCIDRARHRHTPSSWFSPLFTWFAPLFNDE